MRLFHRIGIHIFFYTEPHSPRWKSLAMKSPRQLTKTRSHVPPNSGQNSVAQNSPNPPSMNSTHVDALEETKPRSGGSGNSSAGGTQNSKVNVSTSPAHTLTGITTPPSPNNVFPKPPPQFIPIPTSVSSPSVFPPLPASDFIGVVSPRKKSNTTLDIQNLPQLPQIPIQSQQLQQ